MLKTSGLWHFKALDVFLKSFNLLIRGSGSEVFRWYQAFWVKCVYLFIWRPRCQNCKSANCMFLRNTSRALKCHKPDVSSIISSKDVYLYNISIWNQLCYSNVARSRDLPTFTNSERDLNLYINIINSFINSFQFKYM